MKLQSAHRIEHGYHKSTDAYDFVRNSDEYFDFDKFIVAEGIHAICTRPNLTSEIALLTIERALDKKIRDLLQEKGIGFENSSLNEIEVIWYEQLENAFARANMALFNLRENIPLRPFEGSSAICLAVYQSYAYIASLGICRAYHFRQGRLTQITHDHSPDGRHVIPGLGHLKGVTADIFSWPLETGDRFLLCTSDIWRELTSEQLVEHLNQFAEPKELANHLVESARRQPKDPRDFAVVVVNVLE